LQRRCTAVDCGILMGSFRSWTSSVEHTQLQQQSKEIKKIPEQ
jgi:hypothetical protein